VRSWPAAAVAGARPRCVARRAAPGAGCVLWDCQDAAAGRSKFSGGFVDVPAADQAESPGTLYFLNSPDDDDFFPFLRASRADPPRSCRPTVRGLAWIVWNSWQGGLVVCPTTTKSNKEVGCPEGVVVSKLIGPSAATRQAGVGFFFFLRSELHRRAPATTNMPGNLAGPRCSDSATNDRRRTVDRAGVLFWRSTVMSGGKCWGSVPMDWE